MVDNEKKNRRSTLNDDKVNLTVLKFSNTKVHHPYLLR